MPENLKISDPAVLAKALRHIAQDDRMRKLYGNGIRSKASMLLDSADLIEEQQRELAEYRNIYIQSTYPPAT